MNDYLSLFRDFIEDDVKSTSEILEYLITNHRSITRKAYTNQSYSRLSILCMVFAHLSKYDESLRAFIMASSKHIVTKNMRERIFIILTGIETNTCENGNNKKFHNATVQYKFCGNHGTCACQNADFQYKIHSKSAEEKENIVRKRKSTNEKRFGSEVVLHNEDVKQKARDTNIERYGHSSPLASKEIRKKIYSKNRERYGYDSPLSNKDIQNKKIETMLDRYGVENPAHVAEFQRKKASTNFARYGSVSPFGDKRTRQKSSQTNIERYGTENVMNNAVIRERLHKKNLDKFGAISPFGNREVREKIKETNFERYGVENPLSNTAIQQKREKTILEKFGSSSPFGDTNVRQKAMETKIRKYGADYFSCHDCSDLNIGLLYDSNKDEETWLADIVSKWKEDQQSNPSNKIRSPFSIAISYYRKVMFWTRLHWREKQELINPDNLERGYWQNHIDHIYSIRDGFINNVPAEIVGHWTNLRLISRTANQRKNSKSERTLEEMIDLYMQSQTEAS